VIPIRTCALLLAIAGCAVAQVKPKASEYPAHAAVGTAEIGAENLGHSLSTPRGAFLAGDYIVIDVGLFYKGPAVNVSHQQFLLRINGKKPPLMAQTPGMVAASIKYPDWSDRTEVTMAGTVAGRDIVYGPAPPVERFPGDRRAERPRTAPRMPTGIPAPESEPPPPIEEIVREAALPEGEVKLPAGGYLYFAYKGKLKSIKKLELLYDGPLGQATVLIP
jgi:hypothetical protein